MAEDQRLVELEKLLEREISAAHASRQKPLSSDDVAAIVSRVVHSMEGAVSVGDMKFYSELQELARYIREAKHEIAAIKPKDISTDYIPSATDELDAVVGATEEATNKIMDVCDEISVIAGEVGGEVGDKLIACTTKVFEACNFQDITGQRITKVVEALKHIDSRIEALVRAMGEEIHRGDGDAHKPKHVHAADPDKALLNGPQLPQNAIDQDAIDRLMSGG